MKKQNILIGSPDEIQAFLDALKKDISNLSEGDKVCYNPFPGHYENGIIKSIIEDKVFVVFKCGGEWDNYKNYTAALTPVEDLRKGWVY